jgi:cation transport ATPase
LDLVKIIKEGEQMQVLHEGKEVSSYVEIDKGVLHYGDAIFIEPDSMILTDGIVIGTSFSVVDESSITVESVPVFKQSGMSVYAGSRNLKSPFFDQVTRLVHENSLSVFSQTISEGFSTSRTASVKSSFSSDPTYGRGCIACIYDRISFIYYDITDC